MFECYIHWIVRALIFLDFTNWSLYYFLEDTVFCYVLFQILSMCVSEASEVVKQDRCEGVMYLSVPVSRALCTGLPCSNMYPKALTEVVVYLCAPFM